MNNVVFKNTGKNEDDMKKFDRYTISTNSKFKCTKTKEILRIIFCNVYLTKCAVMFLKEN